MESKIAATHRLQAEKRWDEASQFKDERIAEHRRSGMKRAEAGALAWREMIAKYPPIEVESEEAAQSNLDDTGADTLPDSSPVGFLADATWVYNNLARAKVITASAPSAGSVGLLRWARRNEDDFFKNVWPKALGLATKQDPDERDLEAENLRHVESLEEMLGLKKTG